MRACCSASPKSMASACVLATGRPLTALQVADRGYVLETGAVALTGPANDLLHDRRIIDTYLGLGNKRAAVAAP